MMIIRCLSSPSSSFLGVTLLTLVLQCCFAPSEGFKFPAIFREQQQQQGKQLSDDTSPTDLPPPMFSLDDRTSSGARSAYQLAPFGEGFGFADLFNLFSQRDTKRPPGQLTDAALPFGLSADESNFISMYDDQTPIVLGDATTNNRKPALSQNKGAKDKSTASSTKARLLGFGPWNRIILSNKESSRVDPDQSKLNQSTNTDGGDGTKTHTPASPVILVPGYGGSRLETKLNKTSSVHYFCDSKTDWIDLWINVKQLLPYMIDCLIDNMRLEFDPTTNATRNPAGVDIRVKNGSRVASVEYLNNLQISGFAYFASVIEQLTDGKLGYERELNIRAAPYDFRKAPNELGEYFVNLKESSEQLARQSAGRPITFICHSMGCNNMLYFLHRQSDQWKSQYVRRLISVAAPWAGSVSAMRAAAVGDDLGMPYLFSESKLLLVQRSLPSTIFLFPHRRTFSGIPLVRSNVEPLSSVIIPTEQLAAKPSKQLSDDERPNDLVINHGTEDRRLMTRSPPSSGVSTTSQQEQLTVYTADDFRQFFEDISHPDGYRMWLNTKDLLGNLEAPGVEVWCLVGVGKRTLARIEYSGDFPTSASQELYDDGDGTVTIQSADHCKSWSAEQQQPVYYKQFQADHIGILKDANVMQYIERILSSDLANSL